MSHFETTDFGSHDQVPVSVFEIIPNSGTTDCEHDLTVLVSTGQRIFYRRLSELRRIDATEVAT